MSAGTSLRYRPDIDGLRAFAVLAVAGFHAFPGMVPGGFVGVDVFFVISGFLICSLILRDVECDAFSFLDFYSRRIRRIFPALIVVLAFALVFGLYSLTPDEYRNLGKHVYSGALFISNITLWQEAGYFDAEAQAKPLLHLWSLGIEEQFYLCFPLLLWLCARSGQSFFRWIAGFLLLSFVCNLALAWRWPTADFYSPFSRIWELLAGALLAVMANARRTEWVHTISQAIWPQRHQRQNMALPKGAGRCRKPEELRRARLLRGYYAARRFPLFPATTGRGRVRGCSPPAKTAGSIGSQRVAARLRRMLAEKGLGPATTGLVLLVLSLLWIREDGAHPGLQAALPVAGALLLLAAGPANAVSRLLLTNPVAVFVGKVSYPFYLWHWVLLSYASIVDGGPGPFGPDTRFLRLGLLGLAFWFAVLTFWFLETPVRFLPGFARAKTAALTALLLTVGACGIVVHDHDGYPERFASLVNRPTAHVNAVHGQMQQARKRCARVFPDWTETPTEPGCLFSKEEGKNTLAVLGDSHAWHLFFGLIAQPKKDPGVAMLAASCAAPYLDLVTEPQKNRHWRLQNALLINKGLRYIVEHPELKTVILTHHPPCSYEGVIDMRNTDLEDRDQALENAMRRTFDLLRQHDKRVFVLLDTPGLPFDQRRCMPHPPPNFITIGGSSCKFARSFYDQDPVLNWYKRMLFTTLRDYPEIRVLDLSDRLCDQHFCFLYKNNIFLYMDRQHFTFEGSIHVAEGIYQALERHAEKKP